MSDDVFAAPTADGNGCIQWAVRSARSGMVYPYATEDEARRQLKLTVRPHEWDLLCREVGPWTAVD